jgi:cytoskeletal protein RodZ
MISLSFGIGVLLASILSFIITIFLWFFKYKKEKDHNKKEVWKWWLTFYFIIAGAFFLISLVLMGWAEAEKRKHPTTQSVPLSQPASSLDNLLQQPLTLNIPSLPVSTNTNPFLQPIPQSTPPAPQQSFHFYNQQPQPTYAQLPYPNL